MRFTMAVNGWKALGLFAVLAIGVGVSAAALPKVSMGGSDAWNGQYELRVTCKNEAGYIGYDIYGVSGLVSLGYFDVDETKTVYLDAPNCGGNWTLRKWVSADGVTWQQKGGTHSANVCKPESMWDWDIVDCPGDIEVTAPSGSSSAIVTWVEPTVTSTCCGSGISATTQTHAPGDSFALGTTPVVYTWTDADGDTRTCEFMVIVTTPQDRTPPTVTIITPADGGVYAVGSALLAQWTVSDDSGIVRVVATAAVGSPVDTSPGCHRFIVTATDAAGNTTTATANYCAQYTMLPGFPLDDAGGGGEVDVDPSYIKTSAGGGGETGEPMTRVAFQLLDLAGASVPSIVADLTVVVVTVNASGEEEYEVLLPLYIFEYDAGLERYVLTLPRESLPAGTYDLWIGAEDGSQRVVRIEQ